MTATEQWIKDAGLNGIVLVDAWGEVESALLKSQHWQAVGKTRGWTEPQMIKTTYENQGVEIEATGYFAQMLLFTALLADGLTIEAALNKIA